jgi:predicted DNA-binding protein
MLTKKASKGVKRYQLYLPAEMREMLECIATLEETYASEIVREALLFYAREMHNQTFHDYREGLKAGLSVVQRYAELAAELRATKVTLNDRSQQLRLTQQKLKGIK